MAKQSDLTAYAVAGFNGDESERLLATSPAWYARELGKYLRRSGRSEPSDVRMGRGDSIRCKDMRFTFNHVAAGNLTFARVQ